MYRKSYTRRPRKKYVRKYSRKPVYKRKSKKYNRKSYTSIRKLTVRNDYPMPDVLFTKFKYAGNFQINCSTGGIPGTRLFRMNSLYDPDLTGAGSQPYLFDQLVTSSDGTGLYQRYTVFASKIVVRFMQQVAGTGTPTPTECYIYPSNAESVGLPVSYNDLDELRFIKKGIIMAAGAGDRQMCTLSHYMTIPKVEGISKSDFKGRIESYSAYGQSNPTMCPAWVLAHLPFSNQTGIVLVDVKITYYARLDNISGNTTGS